jgi:NADPH2:quinone reductase
VLADARMAVPRPPAIPPDVAASLVVAGTTAMLLLRETGALVAGESVLVTGAGGGVGAFAVQLARLLGARAVVATASSSQRRELAEWFGADVVVDPAQDGWADAVGEATGGIDLALESSGGPLLGAVLPTLAPFGRVVAYGMSSGVMGALDASAQEALLYRPAMNQTLTGFNLGLWFGLRPDPAARALGELIDHVAQGSVEVHVGATFALSDAAKAHALLESRAVAGKVVLRP